MLIEHLVDMGEEAGAAELSTGDLTGFYQQARVSFNADPEFAERSRRRVVLLQSGDEETLRLWRVLVAESVRYFDVVYEQLGVLLTDDDIVGESFYNDLLAGVVQELDDKGLLVVHDGARCVFPPGFTNREGDPLPVDRPEIRRRIRVRRLRSRRHPSPGARDSAPPGSSTWSEPPRPSISRCASRSPRWPGGSPKRLRPCTCRFGSVLGTGPPHAGDPRRRHRQAGRAARRGGRPGAPGDRGPPVGRSRHLHRIRRR